MTFATNLSYSFLTTSFFATSLSLLKSTGNGANLSISNLSTSVFKLAIFAFSEKLEVSTCVTFFKSIFVAYLERSNLMLIFPPKLLNGSGKYWLFIII